MEEILISLLFLYPGALAEVFDKIFFPCSAGEDRSGETERIARYFAASAVITIATAFLYGKVSGRSAGTIGDIVSALSNLTDFGIYALLSLCVTLAYAWVLHGVKKLFMVLGSLYSKWRYGTICVEASDAWHEILYGEMVKNIGRDKAIVRILNGEHAQIGFVKYWPEKLKDGIILTQCDMVAKFYDYDLERKKDEDKFIGSPWYTLFDPESSTTIEIYHGGKLQDYAREQMRSHVTSDCPTSAD